MKMPPVGPEPKPVVLEVKAGRREGQFIAFFGKQICLFENDSGPLPLGAQTSVMFTRAHYKRVTSGEFEGMFNHNSVSIVFIRPVTSRHKLIAHSGFECSGSMCATTASIYKQVNGKWEFASWMTPGRTGIFEAGNVNVGFNGQKEVPLRPGYCYVDALKWNRGEYPLRCEGMVHPDDASWAHAIRR